MRNSTSWSGPIASTRSGSGRHRRRSSSDCTAHLEALAEDRQYAATQHHDRWKYLTMPTLLLRARQELRPGAGYAVPATVSDRFLQEVTRSEVVEVDANHQTINTHTQAATAIGKFFVDVLGR